MKIARVEHPLTREFDSCSIPCMPPVQPNTKPSIGDEIRRVRGELNVTLQELARRTRIPWQTLQAYETGRVVPPSDRFLVILHACRNVEAPFRLARVAAACALQAA